MQGGRGGQMQGGRGLHQQRNTYGRGNGYINQNSGRGYQNPQQQQARIRPANYKINTTKKYNDNDNCYWSHGHNVPHWHHSGTFPQPYQAHVWTAKKHNTANGCTKGDHKVLQFNGENSQY